jgi:L-rhamnose mutarotase
MSGKHKPLLPPEYKFSSAPKDVKEQLEIYMVRNFTGREEEDRRSSDYAFLQDWKDVLSEFGRVGTRQKEIYAFCGALSRRLGEIIEIDRDLQWSDLAQKLRQQRWWNHYKTLQAAQADIDVSYLSCHTMATHN